MCLLVEKETKNNQYQYRINEIISKNGQVIFKNNLTYKAPLVSTRSNRFWKDLKKFKE